MFATKSRPLAGRQLKYIPKIF